MIISSFGGAFAFLSNFYSCRVIFDERPYRSAEHAYQAAKSLKPDVRKRIALLKTAGEAKRYGRTVVLRPGWDSMRIEIMREVLDSKFSDRLLRQRLLETEDAELVEGNTWGDKFWGQCPLGVGKNHLGKLLMQIRKELRQR